MQLLSSAVRTKEGLQEKLLKKGKSLIHSCPFFLKLSLYEFLRALLDYVKVLMFFSGEIEAKDPLKEPKP